MNDGLSIAEQVESRRRVTIIVEPGHKDFLGLITEQDLVDFGERDRKIVFRISQVEQMARYAIATVAKVNNDHVRRIEADVILEHISNKALHRIKLIGWINAVLMSILIALLTAKICNLL